MIAGEGTPEAAQQAARDLDGLPEIRVLEQPPARVAALDEQRAEIGRLGKHAHGAVAREEAQGLRLRGSRLVDEAHLEDRLVGHGCDPGGDTPSYGAPGVTEKRSHAAATRPGIRANHSRPPGKAVMPCSDSGISTPER